MDGAHGRPEAGVNAAGDEVESRRVFRTTPTVIPASLGWSGSRRPSAVGRWVRTRRRWRVGGGPSPPFDAAAKQCSWAADSPSLHGCHAGGASGCRGRRSKPVGSMPPGQVVVRSGGAWASRDRSGMRPPMWTPRGLVVCWAAADTTGPSRTQLDDQIRNSRLLLTKLGQTPTLPRQLNQ